MSPRRQLRRALRGRPGATSAAAMVATAALLTSAMVASALDAGGTGFLLHFREEGRGVATEGTLLLVLFCAAVTATAGAYADPADRRLAMAANVLLKAALAAAVVFMLAFPELPQFENKSLTARAVLYPILAMSFAARALARRERRRYPTLLDMSWTLVLVIDIVGNDLHWYGNRDEWDDTVHFLSSLPAMFVITSGTFVWLRRRASGVGFGVVVLFAFTIYASLHAFWEMAEYLSDRLTGTELQPGGMEEATANSLAAVAGSLVAIAIMAAWQRAGVLERDFVRPLSGMFAATREPTTHAASPVRTPRAGSGR